MFQNQSTGFLRYTFPFVVCFTHSDVVFRFTVFPIYGKKSYSSDRHSISFNYSIISGVFSDVAIEPFFCLFNTNRNIIMEELIILWVINPFDLFRNIRPLKLSYAYFHFSPHPIYQPLSHCQLEYQNAL